MRNVPWFGYFTVVGLFLLVLLWQSNRVAKLEGAVLSAAAPGGMMAETLEQAQAGLKVSEALRSACGQARLVFKTGFLLVVVFPIAVLLPVLLSGAAPAPTRGGTAKKSSKKIVSARTMTLDDIDLGIPDELHPMRPQTRLILATSGVFLALCVVMAGFLAWLPDAYLRGGDYRAGAVRTGLLFLVAALMVFSGSALAYRLREAHGSAWAAGVRLSAGFVVLGGLAFWFL